MRESISVRLTMPAVVFSVNKKKKKHFPSHFFFPFSWYVFYFIINVILADSGFGGGGVQFFSIFVHSHILLSRIWEKQKQPLLFLFYIWQNRFYCCWHSLHQADVSLNGCGSARERKNASCSNVLHAKTMAESISIIADAFIRWLEWNMSCKSCESHTFFFHEQKHTKTANNMLKQWIARAHFMWQKFAIVLQHVLSFFSISNENKHKIIDGHYSKKLSLLFESVMLE